MFTIVKLYLFTFVNMEKELSINNFLEHYPSFGNQEISGRYLSFEEIQNSLEDLKSNFTVIEIGRSFLNIPIQTIRLGSGNIKILAWSQMHGNESTTTKALFDLFNLFRFKEDSELIQNILKKCTILVIPMLNPDGAARYTRENVNGVDLNRDAQDQKEVESKVLRSCYDDFQPDFCFNLHDQRTIFSAGETKIPATISFLTPSMDKDRSQTESRTESMQVIAAMNEVLQSFIPKQVGRYDDAFNINCTGDTFQSLNTPTILFEAGHFKDYLREDTRKYMALAIFKGFQSIADRTYLNHKIEEYFNIPENQKNLYDVILRNAQNDGKVVDIAIQFNEKIKGKRIHFEPIVQEISGNISKFGHREIDCANKEVKLPTGKFINENDIVATILLNDEQLSIISQ